MDLLEGKENNYLGTRGKEKKSGEARAGGVIFRPNGKVEKKVCVGFGIRLKQ